ncbi:NTP transferase domain-containing protein [Nakamurella leprariae]|uniref:Nucleotidyltransferase family protein n=1 Tax=Nakamurella leprariae TaxID=2803911 RepID=A0A938YAS6_9ACTN|nr:NTP transferase domain-containing protein [Nakamurella leprariae]MBM9466176.1 nucleotidyltransferase family protein [Nakamurella leprariae]
MDPRVGAAVVLAGGAGRRLGGVDKPGLIVGGSTLLERVLAAARAAGATDLVVVGPARPIAADVRQVQERPAGAGPAAGLATGLAALGAGEHPDELVAVLAADLVAPAADTLRRLAAAVLDDPSRADGAVLVDPDGRPQWLIGVWQRTTLHSAVLRRADWAGMPVRAVLPDAVVLVPGSGPDVADIDLPDDLHRWPVRLPDEPSI